VDDIVVGRLGLCVPGVETIHLFLGRRLAGDVEIDVILRVGPVVTNLVLFGHEKILLVYTIPKIGYLVNPVVEMSTAPLARTKYHYRVNTLLLSQNIEFL